MSRENSRATCKRERDIVGCVRVVGSTSGHDDETKMITSSSCVSTCEVLDAVGALDTTSWDLVNDTIKRRKEEEHGS